MAIVRARSINFPVDTRTGPDSSDYARSLNLDDSQFRTGVPGEESHRIGEILIDEDRRRFTLRSPRVDRRTGELLLVVGDMTNVTYEPLSEAQARKYYPHEFTGPAAQAATGKDKQVRA